MRDPEGFNPRQAALAHAAMAERYANGEAALSDVLAELAHTIACGLAYVGDELANLRLSLNESLPLAGRGN